MPVHSVTNPKTGASVAISWSKRLARKHSELPHWARMGANMFVDEVEEGAKKKDFKFVLALGKDGILGLYDKGRIFKGKLRESLPLNHAMGAYVACRMQMLAQWMSISGR